MKLKTLKNPWRRIFSMVLGSKRAHQRDERFNPSPGEIHRSILQKVEARLRQERGKMTTARQENSVSREFGAERNRVRTATT
jgi:hypothetical protein